MLQVNTKRLKQTSEQMKGQISRKEELAERLDQMLLQYGVGWNRQQRNQFAEILDRVHREVDFEKKLLAGLEQIIRNYEKTEKALLRVQEEGIPDTKVVGYARIDLRELVSNLRKWQLMETTD